MNLFRRRPDPQDPIPTDDLPPLDGIDVLAAVEEEFRIADALAGPELDRVRRAGVLLVVVAVDAEHGCADLAFADGTRIRCSVQGEPVLQLSAAAGLADTRLTFNRVRDDAPGRILVFTAAHWTLYLVVDLAVVAPA